MSADLKIDIHAAQRLDSLTEEQLDALPFGAIRVDAQGTILFYSRREAELTGREATAVLGRNFFTEVAPCTVVPEFYGRFRRGVLGGDLSTTFEFVFDFEMHPIQVRIGMRGSDRPGEYWIVVEPLRELKARDRDAARELLERAHAPGGDGRAAVSGTSFDFSQCDREPIAFCGAVQPYGCLLVLDPGTFRVAACSANSGRFLGREPEAVLGRPAGALLGVPELAPDAQGDARFAPAHFRIPAPPPLADLALDLRLSRGGGHLLLEIEPSGEPGAEMDLDRRLHGFDLAALQRRLSGLPDPESLCREAVEALRYLSGFERVLAYRLLPDGDGVVIAESLADGAWTSVLGLRYPATDIPRQARALYLDSPLRYAPSRDHVDIPLLARDAAPGEIDIGIAQLRAHSPIHRAYLERFGVNGSMSLSIVCGQRLWGLVIFHHRAPHPVPPGVRRRLIELAGFLSARLQLLDEQEALRAREAGAAAVNRIVGEIDVKQPFPQGFAGKAELLAGLVGADTVQILHRGEPLFDTRAFGLADADFAELLRFLRAQDMPLWSTDCLSGIFEPAAAYPERLAGVLALFVGLHRDSLVLFGRRRRPYSVRWGSDPASLPFSPGTETNRLGWPSRRFEVWTEERACHAPPWSAVELSAAAALRELTQQVLLASAAHFEALALHDTLTGLPNRERFRQVLDGAIAAVADADGVSALGLLDIDRFKTVNDTLGHDKGDVLLRAVAERVPAALPAGATVARLGGDELALVFAAADPAAAQAVAERVLERLREPIVVGEDRFAITASLGMTLVRSEATAGELLKEADLALYRAKEAGRNCVRGFDGHLRQQALARLELAREVLGRGAAQAVEILLQPQVAICALPSVRRFEVLARWRGSDGRLLMPADFIGAAERSGTRREVTTAVLEAAVALLAETAGDAPPTVLAVNVGAADLEARWFARSLLERLAAARIGPGRLELELAESALLSLTPSVKTSLALLAEGGVGLALDDVGSGFSSLTLLRELPVGLLKIDRPFIRGIGSEPDRGLVAGLLAMARSLGKQAVAEGVETRAQLAVLREMGCDWGQGYLWSPPLPPAEALALRPGGTEGPEAS